MKPRRLQRRAARVAGAVRIIAVTTLVVGMAACERGVAAGASPNVQAQRPECPDSVAITVVDTIRRHGAVVIQQRTITQIPVAGPITNVPEFHDCQRFIRGNTYLDLYAIFASYRLAGLRARLDSLTDTTVYPQYQGHLVAVPAAEIYNYGARYAPLGIEPYFNCLYLFRHLGRWRAKMVPVGKRERDCRDPRVDPDAAPGKELPVQELKPPAFLESDYPPVARWDWDPDSLEQYIGIKCGDAWCEVGDSGFVSSQAHPSSPPVDNVSGGTLSPAELSRVFGIKGWYDAQQLAVGTGDAPGPAWGVIIPHPALGRADHNLSSYFRPWVHVATAVLTDNYPSKLNFKRGANKIYLCNGTATECGVRAPAPTCPAAADGQWWAKIRPKWLWFWQKPTYRCVIYRAHPGLGIPIPGTTRWRWWVHDETTWVRCSQGCCELF